MYIDYTNRKGYVLTKPTLKCLTQVATINISIGCSHQCTYCYARGYSFYPGDGKILIYANLPEKLEKELSSRRKFPKYVFFSTASDAFQPIPQLINVSYEVMRILLSHGIGINLLTKGKIPEKFFNLFQQYKNLIHVQIGITTLNRELQGRIEPYASTPQNRIRNIERLCGAGITPEAKLDPLIPGITDTKSNLRPLFKVLEEYNIKSAGINYLFLRPYIKKNLARIPFMKKVILHYQKSNPLELLAEKSRVYTIDAHYRKNFYKHIIHLAQHYGINAYVCGCKNPDITEELLCGVNWSKHFEKAPMQKKLFN